MTEKMDKEDYLTWAQFRTHPSDKLKKGEFDMICDLHAKYKKHRFYKPCTCSPRTIKNWISDLNIIYERGI